MVAALLLSVAVGLGTYNALADSSRKIPGGCAGVDSYMEDLNDLTQRLYGEYDLGETDIWTPEPFGSPTPDDDDILSASPDELEQLQSSIQWYADELAKLNPPEWLQEWQTARVEYAQLIANLIREARTSGFFAAAIAFMEPIDRAEAHVNELQQGILTLCPTFLESLHNNDSWGDMVDADTPTPEL